MEKDKGRRMSIKNMKKEAAKVRKSSWWRCGMSKGTFSGVKVTVLWVTYVFLGSLAFQYIEDSLTITETTTDHHHWIRFKELAKGHKVQEELLQLKESLQLICPTSTAVNQTFELLSEMATREEEASNKTVSERVEVHMESMVASCGSALFTVEQLTEGRRWSLVDAIYYTMTAVTTIGYGHIYPVTPQGRLFCVLYCLVGVPLTCILLAKSTDLLSSRMERLYNTAQRRHRGMGRSLLYWVTVVYLTVGFLVFMLLPSILLTKLEAWTLEEALYCIFITLTTIGFGDFYPGYDENADYMEYKNLYKMVIVIWIMVALGYWFLLLNFLQKVMRKNMPQRLKKELRRSKKFKKQSEFFRQLVSKVMSQGVQPEQTKKGGGAESSGVVKLMVEVADALESRRPSVAPSGARRESCLVPLTLDQLLEVQVAVRGEAVPSLRSLVATSPHPSSCTLKDLFSQMAHKEPEVTLPLREVLTLVTVIKSVEDQVGGGVAGSLQEGMSTSSTPSSPLSTVTSDDQPDYVPLIRSRKDGKEVLEEVDADDEDDDDEDDDLEEEEEDEEDDDDDDDDDDEDEVVMLSDVEKGKKCGRFNVVL